MEPIKVTELKSRGYVDIVGDFLLGVCVGITYFIMFAFIWVPMLWVLQKWYNFVL
jgi:hypothetical protein